MKKYLLLTVLILTFSFRLLSSNSEPASQNSELMQQANQAYSKQDYSKSIELYKKIIGNGYESFKLYYNLGNACFKSNQLASAILYYEKAYKLNPADEDLDFNLKVANSRIVDKIDALPEIFIKTWWQNIVNIVNTDGWAKLTVVTFFLFFTLLIIYLFSKTLTIRKMSFWLSILILFISIISFVFARQQFNELNKAKEGIVFTPTISIKSSPDQNSIDLFVIHEGLKVKITDQVNDWYEIRIANGSKGWLKITDIEII